jgi:predicted RNase H-like HicB family nuclease
VRVDEDQEKVAMQSVQRFAVVVRADPGDGGYVASVPSIAGVYGQGESFEEAVEDVKEALEFTLEDMRECGEEIPAGEESACEMELTA